MANRNFASGGKIYSMNVRPVMVDTSIVIGAIGAVASFAGAMVASVTRVSTGIYKIKLQNNTNFNTALFQSGAMQSPVTGLSGCRIEIGNNPTAAGQIGSGAEINIKCLDAAGALVDPASGSTIAVLAIYNDSSVKTQA